MLLIKNFSDNTILGKKYKVRINFSDECNCEEKFKIDNIINELINDSKIKKLEIEFIVFSGKSLKETKKLENLIDSVLIQQVININSASDTKVRNNYSRNSTQLTFEVNFDEINGLVNFRTRYNFTGNNNSL